MKPKLDWRAFADDIKTARRLDGLRQGDLAKLILVDKSTICRVEKGTLHCSAINFLLILQWLGRTHHAYVKTKK